MLFSFYGKSQQQLTALVLLAVLSLQTAFAPSVCASDVMEQETLTPELLSQDGSVSARPDALAFKDNGGFIFFDPRTLTFRRSELRDADNSPTIAILGISDAGLASALQIVHKTPYRVIGLDEAPTIDGIPVTVQAVGVQAGSIHREATVNGKLQFRKVSIPHEGAALSGRSDNVESLEDAMRASDIIILDAGNPEGMKSRDYIDRIHRMAMMLGNSLKHLRSMRTEHGGIPQDAYKVIILRGTVPVGMTREIKGIISNASGQDANFDVAYWPEFFSKGHMISQGDTPVVIGLDDVKNPWDASAQMVESRAWQKIQPLISGINGKYFVTNLAAAELSKHNLLMYLAAKLALLNSLYPIVWHHWGDLLTVGRATGLDARIGLANTTPIMAIGGRLIKYLHFLLQGYDPKTYPDDAVIPTENDVTRMIDDLELRLDQERLDEKLLDADYLLSLWISAILASNNATFEYFKERIIESYEVVTQERSLQGKTVSLLGVAYKAGAEDVTRSASLKMAEWLVEQGVKEIRIYDPMAREEFMTWWRKKSEETASRFKGVQIIWMNEPLEAMRGSHLIVYGTALPEVGKIDPRAIKKAVGDRALIVDGVNIYRYWNQPNGIFSLDQVESAGLNYLAFGARPFGPAFQNIPARTVRHEMIDKTTQLPSSTDDPMTALMIGTGYVGLTTGLSLVTAAESGVILPNRKVIGFDISAERIDKLKAGQMPIYEDGMEPLFRQAISGADKAPLQFTTELAPAVKQSEVIYIAVGTPPKPGHEGAIDLVYILKAARSVGEVIAAQSREQRRSNPKLIVVKSTVTSSTFPEIESELNKLGLVLGLDYDLASNPEFLREGKAVYDSGEGVNRLVIGIYPPTIQSIARALRGDGVEDADVLESARQLVRISETRAKNRLLALWEPHRNHFFKKRGYSYPVIVTDSTTSTVSKYLANTNLAQDISLANTFALQSEADGKGTFYRWIQDILKEHDRISRDVFNNPGCGYGGSCFPKDVTAIYYLSMELAGKSVVLGRLAHVLNKIFKRRIATMTARAVAGLSSSRGLNPLYKKRIGLAGITFKAGTGDVREASSAQIALDILMMGGKVEFYDPILHLDPANRDIVLRDFKMELAKIVKAQFPTIVEQIMTEKNRERGGSHPVDQMAAAKIFIEGLFLSGEIKPVDTITDLFLDKNAVVFVNEWPEFKELDYAALVPLMSPNDEGRNPVLIDARNLLSPRELAVLGNKQHFYSSGVGRPGVGEKRASAPRSELRRLISISEPVADLESARSLADSLPGTRDFRRQNLSEMNPVGPRLQSPALALFDNLLPLPGELQNRFGMKGDDARRLLQRQVIASDALPYQAHVDLMTTAPQYLQPAELSMVLPKPGMSQGPIHLVALTSAQQVEISDFAAFLTVLSHHPNDKATLIFTDLSEADARQLLLQKIKEVRDAYDLPESVMDLSKIKVAGALEIDAASILMRIRNQDFQSHQLGVISFNGTRDLGRGLKSVKVFFDPSGHLDTKTSFVLTAALLRQELDQNAGNDYDLVALANHYAISAYDLGAHIAGWLASYERIQTAA